MFKVDNPSTEPDARQVGGGMISRVAEIEREFAALGARTAATAGARAHGAGLIMRLAKTEKTCSDPACGGVLQGIWIWYVCAECEHGSRSQNPAQGADEDAEAVGKGEGE